MNMLKVAEVRMEEQSAKLNDAVNKLEAAEA